MLCVPAPACQAALRQASELWPQRLRGSDGICASDEHNQQNPNSDHAKGNAFDITHDPDHGLDCHRLADWLVAQRDSRIRYLIWNRRIWNPAVSSAWRPYTGSNPHIKHMHCSIFHFVRENIAPWWTRPQETPMPSDPMNPPAYAPAVTLVSTPSGNGYWILTQDGAVYSFGDAAWHGRVTVKQLP